jgi:hypothetical protein
MAIRVECYAGCRGEETPRAFFAGDCRVDVSAILDRWLTPDRRCFRIHGEDGRFYMLEQNVPTGEWQLSETSSSINRNEDKA